MNIVNGSFLFQNQTGVQRYAKEITKLLVEKYDFSVAVPDFKQDRFSENDYIVRTGMLRKLFGDKIWSVIDLPQSLMSTDYVWHPANICVPWRCRHGVTVHDLAVYENPNWFSKGFVRKYKAITGLTIKRSDIIYTVSNFSKDEILRRFKIPDSKVLVTKNSVDSRFFGNPKTDLTRYGVEKPYLLALGTVEPRKNLEYALKAWKKLPDSIKENFQFVVAGGKYSNFQDSFEDKELTTLKGVVFAGYVDDEDLPTIYHEANALVYVSKYEGFGLPPLEACAAGTRVILSDIPVFREIFSDVASFVSLTQIDELVDSMKEALESGSLRVEQNVSLAKSYTWEESAQVINNSVK